MCKSFKMEFFLPEWRLKTIFHHKKRKIFKKCGFKMGKKHTGHFMDQYHKRLVAVFAFGPGRVKGAETEDVDVEGFVPTSWQFNPLSRTSCRLSDSRSQ